MLRSLHVLNYRVLKQVHVPLAPFTVLIGANGSGKSTILEAAQAISDVRFLNANTLWNCKIPHLPTVIAGQFSDSMSLVSFFGERGYVVGLGHPDNIRYRINSNDQTMIINALNSAPLEHISPLLPIKANRLQILPALAKKPSEKEISHENFFPHGEGLATFLANLLLTDQGAFNKFVSYASKVIPNISNISFNTRTIPDKFSLRLHTSNSLVIPAETISDGTIAALCILASVFHNYTASLLILIDDIDHGLHPRSQWELIACIRKMQESNTGLQIIATCHSPLFINECRPEEVVVTALGEDGYTRVKRLTEHPEYEATKGQLSLGELWSGVGEEWVAKA